MQGGVIFGLFSKFSAALVLKSPFPHYKTTRHNASSVCEGKDTERSSEEEEEEQEEEEESAVKKNLGLLPVPSLKGVLVELTFFSDLRSEIFVPKFWILTLSSHSYIKKIGY